MPLREYCQERRGLGTAIWVDLQRWYEVFGDQPFWRWIRRNIDRECDRRDVYRIKWDRFLRELAAELVQKGVEEYRQQPCLPVDLVIRADHSSNRHYFLLPGRKLRSGHPWLYRYISLDDFHFYVSNPMAFRRMRLPQLASAINGGAVTGAVMENSIFGKPQSPVWCTDGSLSLETAATIVRNRLALVPRTHGWVVEIKYPYGLLERQGECLRSPTFLDAARDGACKNWIFVKNRNPGGPGWGYTVDMTRGGSCDRGAPEAVHAPIKIEAGRGGEIALRVLELIEDSLPQVNYREMGDSPRL